MQALGHRDPKDRDLKANICTPVCQMLMACRHAYTSPASPETAQTLRQARHLRRI
jgi:hypothetical protein